MSAIQTFFYPKSDFFGPKVDGFTDFYENKPVEHLIAGCQTEQVQAINRLAQERTQCDEWPEWQRYDGSIIYDALPEHVKEIFESHYLDENGYVDVEGLHIFEKETLKTMSTYQRASHHQNHCPLDRQIIEQFVTCPALSIRLAQGPTFAPQEHRKVLEAPAPCLHLKKGGDSALQYRRVEDILSCDKQKLNVCSKLKSGLFTEMKQEVEKLKRLWSYANKQVKIQSTTDRAALTVMSLFIFSLYGALALVQKRLNIISNLQYRTLALYERVL